MIERVHDGATSRLLINTCATGGRATSRAFQISQYEPLDEYRNEVTDRHAGKPLGGSFHSGIYVAVGEPQTDRQTLAQPGYGNRFAFVVTVSGHSDDPRNSHSVTLHGMNIRTVALIRLLKDVEFWHNTCARHNPSPSGM